MSISITVDTSVMVAVLVGVLVVFLIWMYSIVSTVQVRLKTYLLNKVFPNKRKTSQSIKGNNNNNNVFRAQRNWKRCVETDGTKVICETLQTTITGDASLSDLAGVLSEWKGNQKLAIKEN